jgi:hypothetical protein
MQSTVSSALGALPHNTVLKRAAMLFALLAFVIQSYAVQTHIHPLAKRELAAIAASNIPAPAKNIDPVDVGSCRLCHAVHHAGIFLAPFSFTVPASLSLTSAVFVTLPLFVGAIAPAFPWQSRAPPRH